MVSDIHEKRVKWSWDYFRERRDDRRTYLRVRKLVRSGAALSLDDSAVLFQLERKFSYEDIRWYRSLAESQLRKEKILTAAAAKSAGADSAKSQTWTEYLWGTSSPKDDITDSQTVFSAEQMKELFDAIEYDPETAATALNAGIPRDVSLAICISW